MSRNMRFPTMWYVILCVLRCASVYPFLFSNHFAEEERVSCLMFFVLWLSVFFHLPTVPWAGLQYVIVAFPGHTRLNIMQTRRRKTKLPTVYPKIYLPK